MEAGNGPDDVRARRIARNERMFRSVNEKIRELGRRLDTPLRIVCECGDASCTAEIDLPIEAAETIETDRRRFFVLPGHEQPDVESVVERHDGYFVVEKPEGAIEAAER